MNFYQKYRCTLLIMIAFLQFLLIMPHAGAVIQMSQLYEAETEVTGQDAKERSRALRETFAEVVTRISGSRKAASFPAILSAMKKSERYVQQYQYFQKTVETKSRQTKISTPITIFWARFDKKAIIELLQKNGLPVWREIRPATLVWLAVKAGGKRYLLGNDVINPIREQLDQHAVRRGIPLLYPLMDLEDQQKIGFTDVWGDFSDSIQEASQRYAPEAVLVGRILQDGNGLWNARWQLYNDQAELHWESGSKKIPTLLGKGADGLANHLGSVYAVYEGDQIHTQIALNISGVDSLQSYARVQEYLSTISVISGQQLIQVEGEHLKFMLDVQGKASDLTQVFALENELVPDKSAAINLFSDDVSSQELLQESIKQELQQNVPVENRSVSTSSGTDVEEMLLPEKLYYRMNP